MRRIDAILIGAGQRGADSYAPYASAHPNKLRFVAVVDSDASRRSAFAAAHHIPAERCFAQAEELFALGPMADAVFVCTPDRAHFEPARRALEVGYHVLLEKPIAPSAVECAELVRVARARSKRLEVCHVLRHTRHFAALRSVVQSGLLGEIVHVDHQEQVAYWHMAHSYVRGSWRRNGASCPMILAKCCHDFDVLGWLLNDRVVRLTSHGGLLHFRPERAPEGAPERCTDGCPAAHECPYFAPRIYGELGPLFESVAYDAPLALRAVAGMLRGVSSLGYRARNVFPLADYVPGHASWPRSMLSRSPTARNVEQALEEGPYGLCVYHGDNDVVDHQVVTMTLASGASMTLTMHGHAGIEQRVTRIDGSHGSVFARFGLAASSIEVHEHARGHTQRIDTTNYRVDGHGGGDFGLVQAFVEALAQGQVDEHGEAALESHLLAFAAEEARLAGAWIDMPSFRERHAVEAALTAKPTAPRAAP